MSKRLERSSLGRNRGTNKRIIETSEDSKKSKVEDYSSDETESSSQSSSPDILVPAELSPRSVSKIRSKHRRHERSKDRVEHRKDRSNRRGKHTHRSHHEKKSHSKNKHKNEYKNKSTLSDYNRKMLNESRLSMNDQEINDLDSLINDISRSNKENKSDTENSSNISKESDDNSSVSAEWEDDSINDYENNISSALDDISTITERMEHNLLLSSTYNARSLKQILNKLEDTNYQISSLRSSLQSNRREIQSLKSHLNEISKTSEKRHLDILSYLVVVSSVIFMKKEQSSADNSIQTDNSNIELSVGQTEEALLKIVRSLDPTQTKMLLFDKQIKNLESEIGKERDDEKSDDKREDEATKSE